jgi:hypothetical protein
MAEPDAPRFRRYLLAALLWLSTGWAVSLAILQSLSGTALSDWHSHVFVSVPSLPTIALGMALFWFVISKGDLRSMSGLAAIGALAGAFLMGGAAIAVMAAFQDPDAWLLLLVPGSLLGGVVAGVCLATAFPRAVEWWPAPPHP